MTISLLLAVSIVSTLQAKPNVSDAPPRIANTRGVPSATDVRFGEKVMLFDGKSLDGWTPFLPGGEDPAGTWSVRDGVLVCTGSPVGYIRTEKTYDNFELRLEWRFDPEKGAGNSGVLIRVQPPDQVWPTSIEAQLHSENAGDIWNIGDYPMLTAPARTEGRRTTKEHASSEKPLGEWNQYRIVMNGGELKLFVNSVLQNTATNCQVQPGWIALQSEGAHIEFRKIELRPILSQAPSPTAAE